MRIMTKIVESLEEDCKLGATEVVVRTNLGRVYSKIVDSGEIPKLSLLQLSKMTQIWESMSEKDFFDVYYMAGFEPYDGTLLRVSSEW